MLREWAAHSSFAAYDAAKAEEKASEMATQQSQAEAAVEQAKGASVQKVEELEAQVVVEVQTEVNRVEQETLPQLQLQLEDLKVIMEVKVLMEAPRLSHLVVEVVQVQ